MANMRTRLFADESKSLRSFRVLSQPLASPLSLKASSLNLPTPPPPLFPISLNHIFGFDTDMGLPPMYVPVSYLFLHLTLSL